MNSVNFVGRITADPELKQTTNGKSVVTFTLAVKRPHTKDTTDFHKVIAWAHSAEYLARYARKGDTISVSGYATNREYTDRDSKKRYVTEYIADDLQVFSDRSAAGAAQDLAYNEEQAFPANAGEDGLPF